MVPGNLCFDSTRAASSTAATPEPSSLAPGASAVKFITSVTRLSIWPWMMTTSLGRSVPRWIATMSRTRVGVGMRAPVKVSDGSTMVRQLPHAAEVALELAPRPFERRADAALGVGLRRQRVARAEADQRLDRVAFSCAALTGATIARSLRIGRRRRRRADQEPGSPKQISLRIATLLSLAAQLAFARRRV